MKSFVSEDHLNKTESVHYIMTEESMTWHEARHTCRSYGGDLVTINNCNEVGRLSSFMKAMGVRYTWSGLNGLDEIGKYTWIDGDTSTFRNWYYGQPNSPISQKCIIIANANYCPSVITMADTQCQYKYPALCELKSK